ncbi:MAG: type IV pilus modification protein PilV [Propionivibrio sp.]
MINSARRETGSVLLEAMVAVVVFSFGLLALISMQSAAVRSTTDAKYRADASFLANQIIGQMWGVDVNTAESLDGFANGVAATQANAAECPTGGASASDDTASDWLNSVSQALPGAASDRQQITVVPNVTNNPDGTTSTSILVTVRVCWRDRFSGDDAANDDDDRYHNHMVTARINKNQ